MKVEVHFYRPIINGEQESLQKIIEDAFAKCFILISKFQIKEFGNGCDILFEHDHRDIDYVVRCLTSIFEGLGVTVKIETPFIDPRSIEFTIG
ncbi:MAG: hypothetical protein WDK96_00580 [Candidatus Paceibacterota bacterium]|jgi:hypothetical protein